MDTSDRSLRIIMVDDSAVDIELNKRALRDLGRPMLTEIVCTGTALRELLSRFTPDVILSDFSMPGFSGQEALDIARELVPEIPFIFVSGTIGEELAIEAMRCGAVDYVLKGNLRRLAPAIDRALAGAQQARDHLTIQHALRQSEERFRAIVESTEDWIWEMDASCRNVYSNGSIANLLGRRPEDVVGKDTLRFVVEEDRAEVTTMLNAYVAAQRGWSGWVIRWRHADGSIRLLESSGQPLFDESGEKLLGYRGIDRDVTVRLQQEERIQKQARFQAVLSAHGNAALRARDATELLDTTCRLVVEQGLFKAAAIGLHTSGNKMDMTNSFGDATVLEMIAALGPVSLDEPDRPAREQRPSLTAFRTGRKIITPDYANSDAPAPLREAMARVGVGAQVALPIGSPPWAVLGLFSHEPRHFDEEEMALLDRLTAEIDYARDFIAKSERLEFLAYHNPVTGFPNRAAFFETLGGRLEREPQVIVLADVDRFRHYNNSRGRQFGDKLLTAVGNRLRSLMPDKAAFFHPGDDNFLFAYPSARGVDSAVETVQELLITCCESPFQVEGEEVRLSLHAAVLLAPSHGDNPEAIERDLLGVLAEIGSGDRRVLAYSDELRARAAQRSSLERDLRAALLNDEFELFLQPKFEAASQRLIGAEALLRWRNRERGLVSPAQFIPMLEETGLVVEVGAWVRRRGVAIWQAWEAMGWSGLRVAVNVSARELRHVDFVDDCKALLDPFQGEHGLDIEITESMLMDDIGKSIHVLQELRTLGCKIAIDDFGTGYSSLNYLSRLPADTLKIDQSFTTALTLSPDTLSLVTNIISLAHSLGLTVVAEGVEEEEQAKLLRLLRCDQLQGYLLGRPLPVAEFESKFLA